VLKLLYNNNHLLQFWLHEVTGNKQYSNHGLVRNTIDRCSLAGVSGYNSDSTDSSVSDCVYVETELWTKI